MMATLLKVARRLGVTKKRARSHRTRFLHRLRLPMSNSSYHGRRRMMRYCTVPGVPGPAVAVAAAVAKKLVILIKNDKIINKNIKIVNLEILKVKTWFGDKDL